MFSARNPFLRESIADRIALSCLLFTTLPEMPSLVYLLIAWQVSPGQKDIRLI